MPRARNSRLRTPNGSEVFPEFHGNAARSLPSSRGMGGGIWIFPGKQHIPGDWTSQCFPTLEIWEFPGIPGWNLSIPSIPSIPSFPQQLSMGKGLTWILWRGKGSGKCWNPLGISREKGVGIPGIPTGITAGRIPRRIPRGIPVGSTTPKAKLIPRTRGVLGMSSGILGILGIPGMLGIVRLECCSEGSNLR